MIDPVPAPVPVASTVMVTQASSVKVGKISVEGVGTRIELKDWVELLAAWGMARTVAKSARKVVTEIADFIFEWLSCSVGLDF